MTAAGREVVVTGGAVDTCLGRGSDVFLARLAARAEPDGELAARCERRFQPLEEGAYEAARVRTHHPLTLRLLTALEEELGAFLSALDDELRERTGVVTGSAFANTGAYFDYYQTGTEKGYRLVNPMQFPAVLPNYPAAEVSNAYSLWGTSAAIATGWCAGLEAIGYAADAIRRGDDETMLACGIDELNECSRRALAAAGLGTAMAIRAGVDAARVPGEAIGLLLLQSREAADATGRGALATVHPLASGRGIHWEEADAPGLGAALIREAIAAAGLEVEEIDALFPSTGGSARGDAFEEAVLRQVFGARAASLPHVCVKRSTGDTLAATGALQCLAAAHALSRGVPSPSSRGRALTIRSALVCSAGQDGTFGALVLRGITDPS